jgi:hypothetical protein
MLSFVRFPRRLRLLFEREEFRDELHEERLRSGYVLVPYARLNASAIASILSVIRSRRTDRRTLRQILAPTAWPRTSRLRSPYFRGRTRELELMNRKRFMDLTPR